MDRMFGMMPSKEIEIEKIYKDVYGLKVIIQAGKNGWTVLWADCSSSYQDVEDTAENNFNKALKFAQEKVKLI